MDIEREGATTPVATPSGVAIPSSENVMDVAQEGVVGSLVVVESTPLVAGNELATAMALSDSVHPTSPVATVTAVDALVDEQVPPSLANPFSIPRS